MDSEIEKRMLAKLKETLKKPKEDAFGNDDIVDNLRDEFEQEGSMNSETSNTFSSEELGEDELEDELIDDDFKKSEEDFLESETINDELSHLTEEYDNHEPKQATEAHTEKTEQKTGASKTEQDSFSAEPLSNSIQAPANEPIKAPLPNTAEQKPIKKNSRAGLLFFFVILVIVMIAGVFYFMS
ncbi:MAG: hypothetical protein WC376_00260 [Candidatus Nanoarchaeia archaeon]|jgi:cell division protein FtsN